MNIYKKLNYSLSILNSRVGLLIGINVFLFILTSLISVIEYLFAKSQNHSSQIIYYVSVPSNIETLAYKPWSIFTYMFFHGGIFHLLFNMLWLNWIGKISEEFLNKSKITFIYIIGGIVGGLIYILAYNIFPAYKSDLITSQTIGSSAGVMAIIVATATLLPNYNLQLLLIGNVKLKWVALIYFLFDLLSLGGNNAGGHFTHIGGAFLGFLFIKSLQKGNNLAKPFEKIFRKKRKLKVISNNMHSSSLLHRNPNQSDIDAILDKISLYGYDKLSTEEKQLLFRASNKHEEK